MTLIVWYMCAYVFVFLSFYVFLLHLWHLTATILLNSWIIDWCFFSSGLCILRHLDNHSLWEGKTFAVCCFKIIMYSIQVSDTASAYPQRARPYFFSIHFQSSSVLKDLLWFTQCHVLDKWLLDDSEVPSRNMIQYPRGSHWFTTENFSENKKRLLIPFGYQLFSSQLLLILDEMRNAH